MTDRFEQVYREAGADLTAVPWVRLRPNPVLVGWLEARVLEGRALEGRALVVGCGVGDDAAHLASLGLEVTAFDIAPTAVEAARTRFAGSGVDFRVADWFDLPPEWRGAFDLVVEIGNVQAIATGRDEAFERIAETVALGGTLLVRCYAGAGVAVPGPAMSGPPWPITRDELAGVEQAGLELADLDDTSPGGGGSVWWTAEFVRPQRPHADEPRVAAWTASTVRELAAAMAGRRGQDGRLLVLVDGRSGGGKSTLARRLGRALAAPVVASDDVAWHLHAIEWADEMVDGIITPWRRGDAVDYRPPGWIAKGRPGSVQVPPSETLVIEGVGAGRAQLARLADVVVWVQSDAREAYRRAMVRDVEEGRTLREAEDFWVEWMRSEEPFLATDAPWTRADWIVNGTPVGLGEDELEVAARPRLRGAEAERGR